MLRIGEAGSAMEKFHNIFIQLPAYDGLLVSSIKPKRARECNQKLDLQVNIKTNGNCPRFSIYL